MMMSRRSLFATLLFAAFATPLAAQPAPAPAPAQPKKRPPTHAPKPAADLKNTIYLDLKDGRVTILLRPDLAPKNVAQIKTLTKQGFYNGLAFHRVIAGFMAQTGDPTGTGTGGSKLPNLPAEFTQKAHFLRGTVGMARTDDPNSANSQFFICYVPVPGLDGKYTIIGQVTQGMDVVDKIKKGSGESGMVTDPDKIVKMQLASDVRPAKKPAKKPAKTPAETPSEAPAMPPAEAK